MAGFGSFDGKTARPFLTGIVGIFCVSIASTEFPSFGGVAKIQRIFDGVVLYFSTFPKKLKLVQT
ncbi:hypothetical protein SAMN05421856_1036 [Chryseobacterium taichungense]|uniref:Uncharacterized protein n=1 Tax=Chryseobacterium taichungense TaxID=295069 RepID=A0A1H7Y441_9FLAO|nr:hypothetical protein SAMN05421856_1036 [Chryseobacterium taichungense]